MEDQKIDVLVIKQLLIYGKKLEFLTSQCGHGTMWIFEQVISDSTHILESGSSYIDLIFTSQPDLVMNSGVHSSLHPNCHHQIIHAKFNLKIFYPPQHERVVSHYQHAHNDNPTIHIPIPY